VTKGIYFDSYNTCIYLLLIDTGSVLHEGWAIKESGTALFGKTNWRKRWFRLVQRVDVVTFEYYRLLYVIFISLLL
jgi:hypothetical protein